MATSPDGRLRLVACVAAAAALVPLVMFGAIRMFEPSASAADPAQSAACEAARAYIDFALAQEERGGKVVFSLGSGIGFHIPPPYAWYDLEALFPRSGAPRMLSIPRPAMAAGYGRGDDRNALPACPGVMRDMQRRGYRMGRAAVDHAAGNDLPPGRRPDIWSATVLTIGLPIVSKDGTEAILIESNASGALAGGTSYYLLKRDHGNWHVRGFAPGTVS